MNLFFINLLSDMRNQRIAVITLSVGQAVNKFFFLQINNFHIKFKIISLHPVSGPCALCTIFGLLGIDSCKANIPNIAR